MKSKNSYQFFKPTTANQLNAFEFQSLAYFGDEYDLISENVEEVAKQLAQFKIVILTHLRETSNYIKKNGSYQKNPSIKKWKNGVCMSSKYENIETLVKRIKELSKNKTKIYGYVSASADDPLPYEVRIRGDVLPFGLLEHERKMGSICHDFMSWVQDWLDLESATGCTIDGIFVDCVAKKMISEAVMNNCLSYLANVVKKPKMLNILSSNADDAFFVLKSPYLCQGDYICVESCYLLDSQFPDAEKLSADYVLQLIKTDPRKLNAAGLAYEKKGIILPNYINALNAGLYFQAPVTKTDTNDAFGYCMPYT